MRRVLPCIASVLMATHSDGQVVRVEITRHVSPVPGTEAHLPAGAFEQLQGRIHGELDPAEPGNRIIQDIERAPRNARGLAEYVTTGR